MKKATFILLATIALISTGCTTIAKQAYYGARGAQGEFYELKTVDPAVLATYRSIRLEPFANDLGEHLPSEVITEISKNAPEAIAKEHVFYPEGKAVVVKGTIIHFTGKSGMKGSVTSVVGDGEQCVCRVQLHDSESGEMIGEAICWGIVKSAVRRGSGEIGMGVGKAVAKWCEKRLPEDVREQRKEELKAAEKNAENG